MYEPNNKVVLICGLIALVCFEQTGGLECYACENQDSNKDKCIKTTKQCEQHEDICMTSIKWGLPPYWVPYGDRMHYVSKDCETRMACESKMALTNSQCKRDWYDDWACVECCTGDMCNYYVTLAGNSTIYSTALLLAALTATLLLRKWT